MAFPSASRNPDLVDVIDAAFAYHMEDVHTGLPGKITKWDPKTQKASVKPLVKRIVRGTDGSEQLEALPIITDVPVLFPRGLEAFLSVPLVEGCIVELRFADSSIDAYMAGTGDDTDPGDTRRFDLSDAVAYPSMYPFAKALQDVHAKNIVLGFDKGGMQIHVTPDGKVNIGPKGEADMHAALGEALQAYVDGPLKSWLTAITVPTGVGPSGTPLNSAAFPAFDTSIISTILGIKSG